MRSALKSDISCGGVGVSSCNCYMMTSTGFNIPSAVILVKFDLTLMSDVTVAVAAAVVVPAVCGGEARSVSGRCFSPRILLRLRPYPVLVIL